MKFGHLTDAELCTVLRGRNNLTELERELADRLERAADEHGQAERSGYSWELGDAPVDAP